MVSRRDFVRICTMAGAAVGMSATTVSQIVEAAARGLKPSVVWLHFQECTGCTESLLRTSHPGIAEVILDLISLDYHETLFAASGHQAEAALQDTIKKNAGKFICVVEGAIPTKDGGIYCQVGGRTAVDILNDVGVESGRGHRDRVVRLVGRHSVGGSQSDRRDRRADDPQRQAGRHAARLSVESVQLPRRRAAVRHARHAAEARRARPADVRLRPHDSRALPAAGALRCRPVRQPVRRRGASPGLLPLQARMQGADDARQLLDAGLRRSGRLLADRHRPSVRRLHGAGRGLPHPDARHGPTSSGRSRRTPTRPSTRTQGTDQSRVATAVAGVDRRRAARGGLCRVHGSVERREEDAQRRRAADATSRKRCSVGITRRNAFKLAHRRARRRPSRAPVAAPMPRSGAGGCRRPALRHAPSASAARPAWSPAARPTASSADTELVRRPLSGAARSQREDQDGHQAVSTTAISASFMKAQCMHCIDPACASACMLGAFKKREFGDRHLRRRTYCIGCRYCEVACPFGVPKFEWSKAAPKMVKCELCNHRLAKGQQPACTEVCPRQAVIFGKREDLLREARTRIAANPGQVRPEDLRRDRRRRHAVPLPLARGVREGRPAGARRRLDADAPAHHPARHLQGLRRAGGALRRCSDS